MNNNKKTGYDEIKSMLNTLRNLNETKNFVKPLIKEENEDNQTIDTNPVSSKEQFDNIEVVNDVEVKLVSTDQEDIKLSESEKSSLSQNIDLFRQQVSQIADLDPGFTIGENQIRLDGVITEKEINFVLIAGNESGLYVNSDMLEIDEETIKMLDKLFKFKSTFITSMEPLIKDRMSS
jgi:hypothetical protein